MRKLFQKIFQQQQNFPLYFPKQINVLIKILLLQLGPYSNQPTLSTKYQYCRARTLDANANNGLVVVAYIIYLSISDDR